MIVGIVGSEASKFTRETEQQARRIIRELLTQEGTTAFCSGHCHLGGIDIWTEEIGTELGLVPYVYVPKILSWEGGFKQRNIDIAYMSDEVHCITIKEYPTSYQGMKFNRCYHCNSSDHIKSGGCWTMKYAAKLGKKTALHIIH
jgi:hypothetical protein